MDTNEGESLVGSVRRFGDFGPIYVVKSVEDDMANIEFPESQEKVSIRVEAVLQDPVER